ncbi:MAG: hypothetical protein A2Y65_12575 [Deltaproteobacteria bacterium RBG_13_52_11]|jgi:hypothetical protein|nr:MAG: hypothetical protein A2Y65_12575 [Deltaproteobacteria bacterium RBG_13_52_11]
MVDGDQRKNWHSTSFHDTMPYQIKEDTLAKRAAYRGEKRKKEVSRKKKQEEKRQRRFNKGTSTQQDPEKN